MTIVTEDLNNHFDLEIEPWEVSVGFGEVVAHECERKEQAK